ncbi:flagellar assembly protein FliH [Leeia sp.]|uniref:flagellar assembly protein FliH n=1 Tax=Leeia sp. TaxID=2884678 RepID=UPI0035B1EA52
MSNRVIPAEALTQYQRWEPATNFGVPLAPPESVADPASENHQQAEALLPEAEPEVLMMPTAEELAAIQQQAHDEGYAAGLQMGQDELTHRLAVLTELTGHLSQLVSQTEQQLAADLVQLAVRMAEQVLRDTLREQPQRLLALVQEVIADIPYLGEQPRLYLHPEDLDLLRHSLQVELAPDGWLLQPDPALTRGGCRLETAGGSVDATLETRWQRVLAALGQGHAQPD